VWGAREGEKAGAWNMEIKERKEKKNAKGERRHVKIKEEDLKVQLVMGGKKK
jgi:hypothetical protein